MEVAVLVLMLAASFSGFLFVLYNKYRVRQLIKYLGIFLENGSINRKQFQTMFESYTSFWSYITWFPNKDLYPVMYQNNPFADFCKSSKVILICTGSLTLLGFVGGTIIDSISKQ